MRCGRRNVPWSLTLAAVAAALAMVVGCGAARHEPVVVPHEIEPWNYGPWEGHKLTTAHYEVYTTVSDLVLVGAFPGLIEGAYEYYQQLVPSRRQPAERMKVFLFATRTQWAHFTRRLTGRRAKVFLKIRNGGYSERGVSVMQYVAHQITFPLLAHEGFHQYLHHCVNPDVPAWVNEGLAVVCEGQRWTTGGLERFDRSYNPLRRNQLGEALMRDRLFSLEELLGTHAGRVVHETSARVATYYAQVWMLTLFLWEGQDGKYAAGLENLLHSLGSPDLQRRLRAELVWGERRTMSRGEALFRSFITDDLETFEREYLAFMRERILNEQ